MLPVYVRSSSTAGRLRTETCRSKSRGARRTRSRSTTPRSSKVRHGWVRPRGGAGASRGRGGCIMVWVCQGGRYITGVRWGASWCRVGCITEWGRCITAWGWVHHGAGVSRGGYITGAGRGGVRHGVGCVIVWSRCTTGRFECIMVWSWVYDRVGLGASWCRAGCIMVWTNVCHSARLSAS